MTRLREAQEALAQADPQHMTPLREGSRSRQVMSTYGGVAQRWAVISSEQRRSQSQRTVDKQWLKHSDTAGKVFQKLCRTKFACEADAHPVLANFTQGLRATPLAQAMIRSIAHDGKRG